VSESASASERQTLTPSKTVSASVSERQTLTPSKTVSASASERQTLTPSKTVSASASESERQTLTQSKTVSASASARQTLTPSKTVSASASERQTLTPSKTVSESASASASERQSLSPSKTVSIRSFSDLYHPIKYILIPSQRARAVHTAHELVVSAIVSMTSHNHILSSHQTTPILLTHTSSISYTDDYQSGTKKLWLWSGDRCHTRIHFEIAKDCCCCNRSCIYCWCYIHSCKVGDRCECACG
jgi:hypothetical protein